MNFLTKNRKRIVLLAAFLLFGVRIGLGGFLTSASDITAQSIAAGVNNQRSQRNLTTLNYNSDLAEAAQYKASDMIARNYFSHTDPNGNYIWPTIVTDGYTPYTTLGENLAVDFPDTESLMSAWIDSPEHRANILNQAFQDQGAGVATGNGQGQFTNAMANTFGAQPPKIVSEPKTVTPQPQAQPQHQQTAVQTIPKPAASGTTKTIITTQNNSTPSVPKTIAVSTKPTQIQSGISTASVETDTVVVTPTISNNTLNLHVVFVVDGTASSVSGSVLGVNTAFKNSGDNTYSGDLSLEKYTDYEKQSLVITVLDNSNHESQTTVPLKNFPLPATQNPASVASIGTQISNPDLYNVYKYVVGIFAILFLGIMIADTVLFRRTKQLGETIKHWGEWNLPMILLIAITAITVWWWH